MTDTQTNLNDQRPAIPHDYLRGISATLTFLFTLAAFASNNFIPRAACIAAASITAGIAVAASQKSKG